MRQFRGTLSALDHCLALLPTQEFVVLKEAFIAGDSVRAIRKSQKPFGRKQNIIIQQGSRQRIRLARLQLRRAENAEL